MLNTFLESGVAGGVSSGPVLLEVKGPKQKNFFNEISISSSFVKKKKKAKDFSCEKFEMTKSHVILVALGLWE